MTRDAALSLIRERIGMPPMDTVSDLQLDRYYQGALGVMATELNYVVRTETQGQTLVAGTQYYPLPTDFGEMIWVENNALRYEPRAVHLWDREGLQWRNAPAGTPTQYAIQGRQLILWPPPSAGAVTADPNLAWSYLAASPGATESGAPFLSESAQGLAVLWAAQDYLQVHPTDENSARLAGVKEQLALRLRGVERAARNAIRELNPEITPYTRRTRGAR